MSEPIYEPNKWNKNKYILKSHNCYMYALNKIDKKIMNICKKYIRNKKTFKKNRKKFKNKWDFLWSRPGKAGGYSFSKPYVCKDVIRGILIDCPKSKYMGTKTMNFKCPKKFYRIALFQTKIGKDFHFYRQDKNGMWSHKNGWRKATNKDCDGKLIADPKYSNNGIYKVFCGYFLVPNDSNKKKMSNITRKKKK